MRIAFSGTHASGKSTLVADLHSILSHYRIIDEPYYSLLDEGYLFAAEPDVDDVEIQLERSIALVTESRENDVLFDRCPVDFCAYLAVLPGTSADTMAAWVSSAKDAVQGLDLIVFLPLERPDRIDVSADEGLRLRKRVDRMLREILLDDAWGLGIPVLEVSGTPRERAQIVLHRVGLWA